jgi:hypothetical protein
MKSSADKKRSFREFVVMICLKIQPYIRNSVALQSNQKLAYKYYGPYRVLARVGKVAYRLDLPDTSRIHPVIHVSQLKRAIGPGDQVQTTLPVSNPRLQVPFKIFQHRVCRKGGSSISQVLV